MMRQIILTMNIWRIKRGFTLVELMIVIALIALFLLILRSFSVSANTKQAKVDRMAERVHDVIRDARHFMVIGKKFNNTIPNTRVICIASGK